MVEITLWSDRYDWETWVNYCTLLGVPPNALNITLTVSDVEPTFDEEDEELEELTLESLLQEFTYYGYVTHNGYIVQCVDGEYELNYIHDQSFKKSKHKTLEEALEDLIILIENGRVD